MPFKNKQKKKRKNKNNPRRFYLVVGPYRLVTEPELPNSRVSTLIKHLCCTQDLQNNMQLCGVIPRSPPRASAPLLSDAGLTFTSRLHHPSIPSLQSETLIGGTTTPGFAVSRPGFRAITYYCQVMLILRFVRIKWEKHT